MNVKNSSRFLSCFRLLQKMKKVELYDIHFNSPTFDSKREHLVQDLKHAKFL